MPDHRDGPNQFFEQAKDRFHDWGWFIPPICRDFLDGLYLYIFLDMYIYIIILYCIYIYIHICIYVYNIFFSVPPSLPARFRAKIWKHLTGMMVHRGKYPKITQHFRSVNCLPMISPFCIGSTRASHFPNAFHCLIVM